MTNPFEVEKRKDLLNKIDKNTSIEELQAIAELSTYPKVLQNMVKKIKLIISMFG